MQRSFTTNAYDASWKKIGLALTIASALLGCVGTGVDDDFGSSSDEIIGGAPHDGDPQTVYLMTRGRFSCTGSLIAPRVVLTAQHCVDDGRGGTGPASGFSIGTGPRADGSSEYARVTEVRVARGSTFEGNDIAVLLLGRAGSLTPYEVSYEAPRVGDPIVGVGYGQTDGSRRGLPSGRKYRGTSTVGSLTSREITTARPLPCYGDSGGPLFDGAGRVIGVVSRGTAGTCEGGRGVYTRVDAHRALIEAAIRDTGGPGTTPTPMPTPTPTPTPTPSTLDCSAPFEGTISVGAMLRLECELPAGQVARLVVSAPQSVRTTLTLEGITYAPRDEAAPVYTFRARPSATPFSMTIAGSNRTRPMPLRVELVR